jgi:integrase
MTFNVEHEAEEFHKTRGDSLAPSTKRMRDQTLDMFNDFCKDEFGEDLDSIIEKLMINHEAGYSLLKKYKDYEVTRGIAVPTIRLRFHYVKQYLKRHGINLDDSEKTKDILGKIHKHKRTPVSHEEIEKILLCSDHLLKTLILVQSSSGLRVSELIGLRVGDVTMKDRYQIKVRADNTKTRAERDTFCSKESEPFLEYYLKDKSDDEDIFPIGRMGMTVALRKALSKAGLEKRYDHSYQRTITTHSFRAFFITEMGKMEGFFGHSLAGHDHYMAQYDRYSESMLLEKYIEGEYNLQIFDRVNGKNLEEITELQKKMKVQQDTIEQLKIMVDESLISKEEWSEIKRNLPKLSLH